MCCFYTSLGGVMAHPRHATYFETGKPPHRRPMLIRASAAGRKVRQSAWSGFHRPTVATSINHGHLVITDGVGLQKKMAELDQPNQKRRSVILIRGPVVGSDGDEN